MKAKVWRLCSGIVLAVLALSCGEDSNTPDDTDTGTIQMIMVPEGSFWMGSVSVWAEEDEQPAHWVTLSPYYISKYEITQSQYAEFDSDHVSNFEGLNLPVEGITWYDAARFCNWLSELEGLEKFYGDYGLEIDSSFVEMFWEAGGYRLPTEAEWEYACRATTVLDVYLGRITEPTCEPLDPILDDIAWYCGNAGDETQAVGGRQKNLFGLYDMSGNVWEWCNDWNWEYQPGSSENPHGPVGGNGRVRRGGAWNSTARQCRSANRFLYPPSSASDDLGFRIVRPAW